MKRGMLMLVIGIPLTGVILGLATAYFAFTNTDPEVRVSGEPLSKTSWQEEQLDD